MIALLRVDRPWTEQYLLPLLSWDNPEEAKAVWEGFLWLPRLYQPLLNSFKPQFLKSANHYTELGEHREQFAAFRTYAALAPTEGYTPEEFRSAIGALPQEGLEEVALTLSRALEDTGAQREDYWKNRIQPFWQKIWPKSRNLASKNIANSLARMSISAGDEFPSALNTISDWLQAIEDPYSVVSYLKEYGHCNRFPADALELLNAVFKNQSWLPPELGQCLDAIVQAMPKLSQDARFKRLCEDSRR